MGRTRQYTPVQVELFLITISLLTTILSFACLSFNQNLYRVGSLVTSPVFILVLAGELAKYRLYTKFINKSAGEVKENLTRRKPPSRLQELSKSIVLIGSIAVLIAFLCIVQGAPILEQHTETLTLSVLLSCLTIFPLVLFLGSNHSMQVMRTETCPGIVSSLDVVYLNVLKTTATGVIFCAWASSIAYPLDWDRKWQAYPIPNVVGALAGYALSNVYMFTRICADHLKKSIQRRIGFDL